MDDKDKKNQERIKIAFIIFLVMLIIIITLGLALAFRGEAEKAAEEDKEKKRKRLQEVERKIEPLAKKRSELIEREKLAFRVIRILVAIGIITLNLTLWNTINTDRDLGKQITYNEALLLGYSFIAFILSGTPTKFMEAMKKGTSRIVQIGNKHILTELKELERERDALRQELGVITATQTVLTKN